MLSYWLLRSGLQTVRRVISYYTPLPTWDCWRVVFNLDDYRSFHFGVLWVPHNEHRIVFPELVFAADVLLLHGRLILPLALSFLCYVGTFAALSYPVCLDCRLTKSERFIAVTLAGIVVFWQGCASVLGSPFLIQWTMMQFAAACSFVFLSRLKTATFSLPLLGVVAAATVATYSSGNALVLWPLIVFWALFLKLSRSQLFALTSAGVIEIALYFVNYHVAGALNLRNFFVHPFYSLGYIASYLSMPFGSVGPASAGVAAGLLSIAGTGALFLFAARKRIHLLPAATVLFGYYVFTLLTALLTAAGRMDPGDGQFVAAKVSRYVTVPQMHWGVFILLCLWIVWRQSSAKQTGNALALGLGILLFVCLPQLTPWLDTTANYFAEQQLQTLSVESGLRDKEILRKIYPDPATVSAGLAKLQQLDLSIYHRFRGRWLGQPVRLFSPVRNTMPGAITQMTRVESGFQITGWADFSEWKRPFQWVMITDESGRIIGFGSRPPAGFPFSVRSLTNPSPFGWVGFVAEKWQPKAISAYIVGPSRNELFPLSGSFPVPKESH